MNASGPPKATHTQGAYGIEAGAEELSCRRGRRPEILMRLELGAAARRKAGTKEVKDVPE
jgi:hypothetical protein